MSVTTATPQPSASLDRVIETVFSVLQMALASLTLVPGIPGPVVIVVTTGLAEVHKAYDIYKTNPNDTTYDAVVRIVHQVLTDVGNLLHSTTP